MEITVELKNIYGKDLIYPVCEKAVLLAKLTGSKTLTDSAISTIKALGYTINVQQKITTL